MNFIIKGLCAEPFLHLYGRSEAELQALGVQRFVADSSPGFPDRIEMRDVDIGESLLLLNHTSMGKPSPYRATHAVFVREGAVTQYQSENEIPQVMTSRMLSLRAFDADGMIVDAELATGDELRAAILRLLAYEKVQHIDAHNATRGCYSGRICRL